MVNPIAILMGIAFVLYWFVGESRFLIVILCICGCGLVFVKYLSE